MAEPETVGAGRALQIQRCTGECAGPRGAACVAAAAAGCVARGSHGAHRGVVDLAMVRLRQFMGGDRWTKDRSEERRVGKECRWRGGVGDQWTKSIKSRDSREVNEPT